MKLTILFLSSAVLSNTEIHLPIAGPPNPAPGVAHTTSGPGALMVGIVLVRGDTRVQSFPKCRF
ncbi:MAG: hypothetical protein OSB05_07215 [Akkermansiaceae bacterium]|nr:hypothetical protein [Akkermansiaceae bacterium]